MVDTKCRQCGKDFKTYPFRLASSKGRGICCSKECGYASWRKKYTTHCKVCDKEFVRTGGKIKLGLGIYCSNKCWLSIPENNPRWKEGKCIAVRGYIQVRAHGHPHADVRGYVMEHRLVMESHIGRYLEPKEVIHHVNGDTSDNRLENLILYPSHSAHMATHHGRNRTVVL